MNYLNELLPQALTSALGWTLLHSLWQGALAALVVAALMLLLHRSSSTIRYFVAVTALFTTFCMTVATFMVLYDAASEIGPANATTTVSSGMATISSAVRPWKITQPAVMFPAQLAAYAQYFNYHLPVIVTVWLVGMALLLVRTLGGLAYVQRLKHYRVQNLPLEWQQRLANLRRQILIDQSVRLVESAMVKVPLIIGYLKPVILLPIGTIAGLPVKQVEAILAHELAHIRRQNYLVNLLQSIVEIVLFYHPAIWWMSGCVREEREHCCDDAAISVCGDSLTYAKALANLTALNLETPELAMALTGKSGLLLSRIDRFMKQLRRNPTFSEGIVAAFVLVASLTAVSLSANAGFDFRKRLAGNSKLASHSIVNKQSPSVTPPGDTIRERSEITIIKDRKGRITELYVNGKKIPKDQIAEYQAIIEARTQAIPVDPFSPPAPVAQPHVVPAVPSSPDANVIAPAAVESLSGVLAPMSAIAPTPSARGARPNASVDIMAPSVAGVRSNHIYMGDEEDEQEQQMEKISQEMERVTEEIERLNERMDQEMEKVEGNQPESTKKLEEEMRAKHRQMDNLVRKQSALSKEQSRKAELDMRHQEDKLKQQEIEMHRQEDEMRHQEAQMRREEARLQDAEKELVNTLINDGLVPKESSSNNIRFKINHSAMHVNGQKQSQAMHEKYLKLFEKLHGHPLTEGVTWMLNERTD